MNTQAIFTHIGNIKAGDIISHHGDIITLCNKDIKINTFMGTTLLGDSYRLGSKMVEKIIIVKD